MLWLFEVITEGNSRKTKSDVFYFLLGYSESVPVFMQNPNKLYVIY